MQLKKQYNWDFIPTEEKQDAYANIIKELNIYDYKTFPLLPELERKKIIQSIIFKIRTVNIFPIFYFNEKGIEKEIQSVINKDVAFNEDNSLSIYSSQGLLLLDYLFPNLHHATSLAGKKSMYDRFYDDNFLYQCIQQYICTNKINNMRTVFFSTGRYIWNTPINFSPLRAKAIYERFCPPNGIIYDYSCGYGGRMLGALSSKNNYYYIGTDPNTDTYLNLLNLGKLINKVTNKNNNFTVYHSCSEDLILKKESVDFAFSCPPFFNLETYSLEKTQSNIKYPNYEDWLNIYVRKTIQNCYSALKEDGLFGVDLMNFWSTNKKINLVDDWIAIAIEEGFYLKGIFPIESKARKQRNPDKENIYIFTKKSNIELPNYTNKESLNKYLKSKEEYLKKTFRKNNITIAIYDVFGELQSTYKNYLDAAIALEISQTEIKNKKVINNKHIRIYRGDEKVLSTIEIKKPVCSLNNIYFYSLSDLARYLKISRQAVSQARINKRKDICKYPVQWL